uniref:C2H2-type domain-containing protein n=1 Tax=Meloidogyne hapla TaxID=6305 RepID=A0A1I8BRC4_MELHA
MEEERELQQQRINLQIAEQQERDIRQQKIEIQNRIAELEQKVKKRKEGQGTSGTSNLVANESCNPQVFNYSSGSFGVSAGTFFQNSHQNYQSSSQMPFNLSGPVSLYGDGSGCSTSVLGDRPCHQANIPGTSQPFYGSYPQFPGGNSNDLELLPPSTSDTGDGNFRCDFPGCEKVCKTKAGLKSHKITMHIKKGELSFEKQ